MEGHGCIGERLSRDGSIDGLSKTAMLSCIFVLPTEAIKDVRQRVGVALVRYLVELQFAIYQMIA
jgi:hypothetical protein